MVKGHLKIYTKYYYYFYYVFTPTYRPYLFFLNIGILLKYSIQLRLY